MLEQLCPHTWQPSISKAVGQLQDLFFQSTGQHSVSPSSPASRDPSHPAAQPTHCCLLLLFLLRSLHYIPKGSKSLPEASHLIAPWSLNFISWCWPKPNKNLPGVEALLPPLLQVTGAGDFSELPSFPTSMQDSLLVLTKSVIWYKWAKQDITVSQEFLCRLLSCWTPSLGMSLSDIIDLPKIFKNKALLIVYHTKNSMHSFLNSTRLWALSKKKYAHYALTIGCGRGTFALSGLSFIPFNSARCTSLPKMLLPALAYS